MNDRLIYVQRMEKSMYDKLFFVDKLFDNITTFIDFGCADGTLISYAQHYMDCEFIGYDTSEQMISLAKEKNLNAKFYTNWKDIAKHLNYDFFDCAINLSSVIHEVYSYATSQKDIDDFWDIVLNSNFKYIIIRDMSNTNKFWQNNNILYQIYNRYPKQIKDFEDIYGKITTQKQLVHFLLKYKYVENWDREVKENYLPISLHDILEMPNTLAKYNIEYKEKYCLPYIKHMIDTEFNTDFTDNTHYKLILKRIY